MDDAEKMNRKEKEAIDFILYMEDNLVVSRHPSGSSPHYRADTKKSAKLPNEKK